jgi:hypothetical protein
VIHYRHSFKSLPAYSKEYKGFSGEKELFDPPSPAEASSEPEPPSPPQDPPT